MKERDVVKQIRELLDILSNKGLLHYSRISTTGIPRGDNHFSPNSSRGLPDFMLWLPKGTWIGIEAKSAKGKLSVSQQVFESTMLNFGQHYHVVRNVDEVIHVLRRHGISL